MIFFRVEASVFISGEDEGGAILLDEADCSNEVVVVRVEGSDVGKRGFEFGLEEFSFVPVVYVGLDVLVGRVGNEALILKRAKHEWGFEDFLR